LSSRSSQAQAIDAAPQASDRQVRIVDADVHPAPLPSDLNSRLGPRWRSHLERFGARVAAAPAIYPRVRNAGYRADARPDGGFPGSDLGLLRRQLLEEYGVDYGILNPLHSQVYGAESAELGAAVCRAVNDWIREEWLDAEPRLLSSLCVPFEHSDLATEEIEHHAGDARFVQVLLPGSAELPLGNRKYWPIYAAAAAASTPVAIHTGGIEMHRGAGWPSYYLEEHVWNGNMMAAAVMSLVCEGVFARFPTLQVILEEGGITWANPLIWSLDAGWSLLREELPHLERPPSEYVRDHFWFTTQPIEEPADPRHLVQALEHLGMDDRIMFATDYPHWDFDSPTQALPRELPEELRAKIMAGNACRLYGLPREAREA
jgi:predicted TIM-barrel fold metal-dependent hydrolase